MTREPIAIGGLRNLSVKHFFEQMPMASLLIFTAVAYNGHVHETTQRLK